MNAQLAEQTKTGADVLVEMLEARDTKYVFGVPGAENRQSIRHLARLLHSTPRRNPSV